MKPLEPAHPPNHPLHPHTTDDGLKLKNTKTMKYKSNSCTWTFDEQNESKKDKSEIKREHKNMIFYKYLIRKKNIKFVIRVVFGLSKISILVHGFAPILTF